MPTAEQLSRLIGDIYDATLDPALWSKVLGECAQFVGGTSATLYAKDAARKNGLVYYDDGGIDPYYKQSYFETYVKLDPANTGHYFADIEQPVSMVDLIPYDEFIETRFYREWVRPQGIADFLSAVLDKSSTTAAMFGVFRNERQGLVDDEMRRRMRLIVPHVRRAVLIGRALDIKGTEAATFSDVLDSIKAGMLLVDAGGRIVHANTPGHVMLDRADIVRAEAGRLSTRDPEADRTLREAICGAAEGDSAVGIKGIAVPLSARSGDRYIAHVLPLTSGARRRASASYVAVAALLVHKAMLDVPSPPEVIAKTYKLTPSELRVLLAVVQVGGVSETAEALGIGEATVKTHLNRIFSKTSCRRQADLVRLVSAFSNPLVAQS
jgi:DNA-binding CsgD family transcriptional regulator